MSAAVLGAMGFERSELANLTETQLTEYGKALKTEMDVSQTAEV